VFNGQSTVPLLIHLPTERNVAANVPNRRKTYEKTVYIISLTRLDQKSSRRDLNVKSLPHIVLFFDNPTFQRQQCCAAIVDQNLCGTHIVRFICVCYLEQNPFDQRTHLVQIKRTVFSIAVRLLEDTTRMFGIRGTLTALDIYRPQGIIVLLPTHQIDFSATVFLYTPNRQVACDRKQSIFVQYSTYVSNAHIGRLSVGHD
jgi:hypothetical protein